jgi:cobalt-zinc-cadmium efflux system protein
MEHATIHKRLALTFAITLGILGVEVVGGLISNSIALLSDAGHVFTDSLALGLSLAASWASRRPQDIHATYGYHRVGVLAAAINGLALLAVAGAIFAESFQRLASPPAVDLGVMMPVAVFGLIANLAMIRVLGHGHEDLNLRSAWLHVLGDTLSSAGVIVSGVVVWLTGWRYADPVAGILIGAVIVTGGLRVIAESLGVFLDLVPRGFQIDRIAEDLAGIPGVRGLHHVHLRAHAYKRLAFSAHVWVDDRMLSEVEAIGRAIEERLHTMGIGHVTLQYETEVCGEPDDLYCARCAVHKHGHDH